MADFRAYQPSFTAGELSPALGARVDLTKYQSGLRTALKEFRVPVFFPPMRYCTDNAAMSAGLADVLLRDGRISALDLDAITYSQLT